MHFATSSSRWREPSQKTLSIQKFQDPESCLTYVGTSLEFRLEFCPNLCLNFDLIFGLNFGLKFVWIFVSILLSEFCCLNFVWIFPYFIGFCEFRHVWILSEFLSEFCLNLSDFCLNFVWIFVWILSELKQDTRKGRESKKLRIENQFFPTKFWHRSIWPMAAHKMTPGQSQTLGCNFENWSLTKKENTKKSRIGATAAHPAFFGGDVMDLSSSLFLGMEATPKKGGGQKRGILLFYTDGPWSPFFWGYPWKMRDPPFSFFFVDCVFRVCMKDFLCLERPLWIWSRRPRAKGVGVDPCFMKGRPTSKKLPTQVKAQFTQTSSEQFVQIVPLFPVKQAEKRQKSLRKLFVQTVFIWGGVFVGWVAFPWLFDNAC